jgi:hypothetical protein
MRLSNGGVLIPPFQGVAVIEYSDRIQMSPTYWCREFVGFGCAQVTKPDAVATKNMNPFEWALTRSGQVWVIAWWERFEDGREKALQINFLNGESSEDAAREAAQRLFEFANETKEYLEMLGRCFEQKEEDIEFLRNRFPEGCPSPQSVEEYDLYQARLKVLAGIQPKTVTLLNQSETTGDKEERVHCEREAVSSYFAELAHHWNPEQVLEWQRRNPLRSEWLCEFARVLKNPARRLDSIDHTIVLHWLRRGLNLLTAEELASFVFDVTGELLEPATIQKRRQRLGLTTKRPPGPPPRFLRWLLGD